jgi:hypothetical protein
LGKIQPLGEAGAYWRSALIAATIASLLSAGRQPYTLDDFMPAEPMDPPTPEEEIAAAKARMDSLFSSMGGGR